MSYIISYYSKLPKILLFLIITCACFGFLILYSAGQNNLYPFAAKQIINFAIFLPIMFVIAMSNPRFIYKYAYLPLIVVLMLLVVVMLVGHTAMGATRWLSLGPIRIQPSELAKISIVLFLARYFHDITVNQVRSLIYLAIPSGVSIICAGLIIKQPDLGTGIIVFLVSGIMFFLAGVRQWVFWASFGSIFIVSPLIWQKLHDYQKKRIYIFLDPEQDPLDSGYNIIQSKIAIGSGGLFGRGIGEGSQAHLSFLPEHQTDFIFACLCEDLGFAGAIFLIMLYTTITYLALSISINTRTLFLKLVASGCISIFFLHFAINMGMVMGILPVVGIPLPFMSYGGTMMGSILICFGLIMNAHVNRNIKL
ncbi:MAG: rod shape-determining protein RodA [Rickettsiaceae bacterium]|nr:rod shape-determining protein RodA [Rickettsiaceae bacterium]